MKDERKPSPRKALMKPFEVVGISAVCGAFVFLIVVYTLKNWTLALVLGGAAIVLVLLILALLLLSYKPNPDAPVFLDRFEKPDADGDAEAPAEPGSDETPAP